MHRHASILVWAFVAVTLIECVRSDVTGTDLCEAEDGAIGNALLQDRRDGWKNFATNSLVHPEKRQPPLNLCVENHLVPELFVVGAQKCATTVLFSELSNGSSFIKAPGLNDTEGLRWKKRFKWFAKEPHVFDRDHNFNKGRAAWLTRYPACPPYRAVALDMTPMLHVEAVPGRIVKWYGLDSQRLTFVVLLRDPLARMQSAFHHNSIALRRYGLGTNVSFQQYVSNVLLDPTYCEKRQLTGMTKDVDAFCDSLYAHQLATWFAHFSGSQFLVVPYRYVVDRTNETSTVAEALFKRFGIPGNHSPWVSGQSPWVVGFQGSYDPIDEELGSDLRTKLQKLLWDLSGADKVAKLLVEHGANLYDQVGEFSGEGERTQEDVAQWLARNW